MKIRLTLSVLIAMIVLRSVTAYAVLPPDLMANGNGTTQRAWPLMSPLPKPEGLRPCCAFGYNLHAEVLKVPVPFYQLDNVVTADTLGRHRYNDSTLAGLANLIGIGSERNGIVYTSRGGFVDTAHVRDTADMTVYLFSHIQPRLGQHFTLQLDDELAQRHLVFNAFTPPASAGDRYTLAALLSVRLAFQIAAWHEIAQWYGFCSVPGFSEGISAFSPEDLYSNLFGARLALALIFSGQTASPGMYEAAMSHALPLALVQLGAHSANGTRFHFDMLDGRWWNSKLRVPEKYLVLRRNYSVSDSRAPTPVPGEQAPPLALSLPHHWQHYDLDTLAQLQLWPGSSMARLPEPKIRYTSADFGKLAAFACEQDWRTGPAKETGSPPCLATPK